MTLHPAFRWLFVSILLAVPPLLAQGSAARKEPPSLERGFKPEKLYNVLGLDTVNPFNGNLIIRIPLGLQYPNDGGMSYGLTLTYNSKLWDYREENGFDAAANTTRDYMHPIPSRRSNAGLGWLLSLGRLIAPDDPMHTEILNVPSRTRKGCEAKSSPTDPCVVRQWIYESPDGADHTLWTNYKGLQDPADAAAGTWYTDDGTYIRMLEGPTDASGERRHLEFPDGSRHTFLGQRGNDGEPLVWKIVAIEDAYRNKVTIAYDSHYHDRHWTISDDFGRAITVAFEPYATAPDRLNNRVVRTIEFPAPSDNGQPRRMRYEFSYYDEADGELGSVTVPPGCAGWTPSTVTEYPVQLLRAIRLPDDTEFVFGYDRATGAADLQSNVCHQGEITSMKLPTGGSVQWTYRTYALSMGTCRDMQWANFTPGIATRKLVEDDNRTSLWNYDQRLDHAQVCTACTPDQIELLNGRLAHLGPSLRDILVQPRAESITVVRSPGGDEVHHYFSTLPADFARSNEFDDDPEPPSQFCEKWNGAELGLSIARSQELRLSDGKRAFLSTKAYECNGTCTLKRSTYVRYAIDGPTADRATPRLVAQRTVFHDDADHWIDVFYDDFDGYGHHRRETTRSSFTPTASGKQYERVSEKLFNPGSGVRGERLQSPTTLFFAPSSPWLLNLHPTATVTEREYDPATHSSTPLPGGRTSKAFYFFNPANGFLEAVRTVRSDSGAAAAGDVIAVFTNEPKGARTSGNVAGEVWGLAANGSVDATPTLQSITPHYKIDHTYRHGVLAQSRRRGTAARPLADEFFSLDLTIDPNSGVPLESRDAAGVPTVYRYDVYGRLIEERVDPASQRTEYVYHPHASPSSRARVEIVRHGASGPLARSEVIFDSLGRITRNRELMASGQWSVRETLHDADGQKQSVSEAGVGDTPRAHKTVYQYDAFGRPLTVTAPDSTVTTFAYGGVREKRTYVQLNDPPQLTLLSRETTDAFGRLAAVAECSAHESCASENELTTTSYRYDVADRLLSVSTTDPTTSVSQQRTFTYDGAGFLLGETHPELAAAGVAYEGYDAKGHPAAKTIGSAAGPFRLAFTYDGAERLRITKDAQNRPLQELTYQLGRLAAQTRHNYLAGGDHTVTDSFDYDAAGRIEKKTTVLAGASTGTQQFEHAFAWTELNRPAKINFPTCASCGIPGARGIDLHYEQGFLRRVDGFTAPNRPIAYYPSGALASLPHASGNTELVEDVRGEDPHGMPRPGSIAFLNAKSCSLITAIEPAEQRILAGQTATFSVGATGTGITFQWYQGERGDTSTPVATTASFQTPPLQQTTKYWVRITEAQTNCVDDSATVTAYVCVPLRIVEQPQGHVVPKTTPPAVETISVAVVGENPRYRWIKTTASGGVQVLPHTGPSFTDTIKEHTTYRVTVAATACDGTEVTKESAEAVYDVAECPQPFILDLPPAAVIDEPGEAVLLQMRLLDPRSTATYAWYRNGQLVTTNTSGELTVAGQNGDTFYARVAVTQYCGTSETPVTLTYLSNRTRVSVYGTCPPLPPLTVDKTILEVPPQPGVDAAFNASCDWTNVSYQWYSGETGDTRFPINSTSQSRLGVSQPGTYWVRASSACGSRRDSDTLIVKTAGCDPIRFTAHPRSVDVAAGTAVTLSVDATSSPALLEQHYQWFERTSSGPRAMGHGPSLTVSPRTTATYFVRIETNCDSAESFPATVHVTSCQSIAVEQQPLDASVSEGMQGVVGITARPVALADVIRYQWYEGERGDTSRPVTTVVADQATLRIAPAQTTRYWVRLSLERGGTCTVDSRTVTIAVCRTPRLTHALEQPNVAPGQRAFLAVDAEGDNLSYAWFQGVLGDTSRPIGGNNSRIAVTPQETTKYWVRITSDCAAPVADATLDAGPAVVTFCPTVETPQASRSVVMPGSTVTLSVAANGAGLTYQWYRGPRGDVSQPVGSSASITSPPIQADSTFWVLVTSGNCNITSAEVSVTLCGIPSVAWNAVEQNVRAGQSQILGVGVLPVEGTTMTFYQGTAGDIAGSTILAGPTISAGIAIAPQTTTSYWVRAQNGNCFSDTPTMTIRVCIPAIATHPASRTVNAGAAVQLSVAATGGPLTYQWYQGDSGVTTTPVGTNSATLDFTAAATAKYWVRVTGACGQPVDSTAAVVTVCAAPQVQSINRPVAARGEQRTLNVLATGNGLHYQWYEGALGVTARAVGTDANNYTTAANDTTDFWVHITDACNNSVDAATTFSVYPLIVTEPAHKRITKGTATTLSVAADGNRLTYQWFEGSGTANPVGTNAATLTTPVLQAPASYWVRITSVDAAVQSATANVTLCTAPDYNVANSQVSGANVTLSIPSPAAGTTYQWYRGTTGDVANPAGSGASVVVQPTATTSYWFRATDAACSADSPTIPVVICKPAITQQPANGAINAGQSHPLSVTATGNAPLSYQWYTGAPGTTTNPVPGAITASVTVTPGSTTSYWVRIQNGGGGAACSVDSAAATVSVCQPPQITAQPSVHSVIDPGQTATVSVTATGTNPTYQWYLGASGDTSVPIGTAATLSYPFNESRRVWVRVRACGTSVDSNAVLVSVRPTITAQPQSVSITRGSPATFSVTVDGTWLEYRWYEGPRFDTSRPVGTNASSFTTPALTADTSYWVRVVSGVANRDSEAAVASMCTVPNVTVHQPSQTSGDGVTFTVTNPGALSYTWYRGPSGNTSQPLATVTTSASFTVAPTETTSYWVRATYPTCTGDSATIVVPICWPKISQQPQNASIVEGHFAPLSVAATGTPALSYQWYIGPAGVTTTPIGGAIGPAVTVAPTTNTQYWVRVSSAAGASCAVNSIAATVTVCNLPRITTQPQNTVVLQAGTTGALRVYTSGSNLTYRWYAGLPGDTSRPVSGATTDLLSLTAQDTERYWVRVSNSCGTVDSAAAWISVRPQVTGPANVSLKAGSTATFTVSASGSYLSYQWFRSDGQAVGTNAPTYVTPPLSSAASYACVVTSGSAPQTSAWATASLCDDAPPIFSGPESSPAGSCRSVAVGVNPAVSIVRWYRGSRGDTSSFAGQGEQINVCPAAFGTYWCRVFNAESGCYVDSQPVTVQ